MTNTTGWREGQQGILYIEKPPGATLDYGRDYTNFLSTGDRLAASTWSVVPIAGDTDPLVLTRENIISVDGKTAMLYIGGGTLNNEYTVTNTATTNNGLVAVTIARVIIKQRSN